jgi:hypothetical protein
MHPFRDYDLHGLLADGMIFGEKNVVEIAWVKGCLFQLNFIGGSFFDERE